jgi:hypothetical protein
MTTELPTEIEKAFERGEKKRAPIKIGRFSAFNCRVSNG